MGFTNFSSFAASDAVSDDTIESDRSLNDPYWKGTFEKNLYESSSPVISTSSKSSSATDEPDSAVMDDKPKTLPKRSMASMSTLNRIGGMVVGSAAVYHGYKRNESVGWAVVWGILGSAFWPIAAPVMIAQGFGQPKKK